MTLLTRSSFARGWVPDVDAVNAPADALLRMDNLTLDEAGAVSLRLGSDVLNAPYVDPSIVNVQSFVLNGVRYRMAAAGNRVYANHAAIISGIAAGPGEIPFESYLGRIFFARGLTKRKYNGAVVDHWGLDMTGGTPTVAINAPASKLFATCDASDGFVWEEDAGLPNIYPTGVDGTPNGSLAVFPNITTHRGVVTKTFGAPTNFMALSGGVDGTDRDLIELWVWLADPASLVFVEMDVDVNDGSFQKDYYSHDFVNEAEDPLNPDATGDLATNFGPQGVTRRRVVSATTPVVGRAVSRFRRDNLGPTAFGWSRLQARRSAFNRIGQTTNKDWTTVKAIRFVLKSTLNFEVYFDNVQVVSGATAAPNAWRYILVRDDGQYITKSEPSAESDQALITPTGAVVTVPGDGGRDPQTNQVWLFRMGEGLDAFYRVATANIAGSGAVTFTDQLSTIDALTVNIRLEMDNVVPPDNIIGIAGPYYDRLFVLTNEGFLFPSRRLAPDTFGDNQSIKVTGPDEVPYWIAKALGGLYIGTSKDIYLLEGTGAELPDETIDFTKRPLNIDHPPIGPSVAQEGNFLVYLSHDGWRIMAGAGSQPIAGLTSRLWRGQTRHGVAPIVASGRLRAAISHGELVACTPEASGLQSVQRYNFVAQRWMRHTYPALFQCITRERDGTLLAGDSAGRLWTLDSNTTASDAGAAIPWFLEHKADDADAPTARKHAWDLRAQVNTGGAAIAIVGTLDTGRQITLAGTPAADSTLLTAVFDGLGAWRSLQIAMSGTSTAMRLRNWVAGYELHPPLTRGQLPAQDDGRAGIKTILGLQLRLCTLGVPVSVTPFLDNVAQTAFSVTTDRDDPSDVTLRFPAALEASNVAVAFSGDVELWSLTPLVSSVRPLGVKTFDTGPIDLGVELVWIRHFRLKVRPTAPITIAIYMDGALVTSVVSDATLVNADHVIPIDVGRGVKGRSPRLVLTSASEFYPYHIEVLRRLTGNTREKPSLKVPLAIGGAA